MEASEFRTVLPINNQGLALGVLADGSWAVCGDSLPIGPAAERTRLRALLPLLESPFSEIEAVVAEQAPGQPGPPWPELLTLALRWPTAYWADRALDWIEGGCGGQELLDVVDEIGPRGRDRSADFPHRVLRLRTGPAPTPKVAQ